MTCQGIHPVQPVLVEMPLHAWVELRGGNLPGAQPKKRIVVFGDSEEMGRLRGVKCLRPRLEPRTAIKKRRKKHATITVDGWSGSGTHARVVHRTGVGTAR